MLAWFLAPLVALAPLPVADPLIDDLRTLSAPRMEGRAPATRGSARARAYIVERLREIGAQPVRARYERDFTFTHRDQERRGTNIVASFDGTDHTDPRVIVIGAHYDHVGLQNGKLHPGADDNASGVAALLAITESLAKAPPRHRVILGFWDAEEPGFYGAKAFVADPPIPLDRIAMNINLDMIGRGDKGELYAVGGRTYPSLQPLLDALAKDAPVTLRFGHEGAELGDNDWTALSDQAAFHAQGIPFVYFGVEDHPDYHKPTDTFDRIPLDFYRGSVATVLQAVRAFDMGLDTAAPPRLAERGDGR